jgi:sugar lactone lactonase YvrE
VRAAPAALLLALAAGGCGGAARQAGPTGHIEAGATFAQGGPEQLAFDRVGNLYGVDCQDSWIFRADTQGRLWIVGGTGEQGFTGNGGTAAQAQFTCPSGIAVDATGNVYVSDHDNRVRRIGPRGVVHPFAGAGAIPPLDSNGGGFAGDGGPARQARFRAPAALAIDRRGNLFVADRGNGAVRRIGVDGTITTVARVDEPAGLAFDAAGTLYVATPSDVRRVGRHGVSTTYARLKHPDAIAFDARGNLFVAQADENVVRRVDRRGTITIVVGTGRAGYAGDGGPAAKAELDRPDALAFDSRGNLYIGDHGNGAIRKVDRKGVITTFCDGRLT